MCLLPPDASICCTFLTVPERRFEVLEKSVAALSRNEFWSFTSLRISRLIWEERRGGGERGRWGAVVCVV